MVSISSLSYSKPLGSQKLLQNAFSAVTYVDNVWVDAMDRVRTMTVNMIKKRLGGIRLIGCAGKHEKVQSKISPRTCKDRTDNAGCFHVSDGYYNNDTVLGKLAEGAVLVEVLNAAGVEECKTAGILVNDIRERLKKHKEGTGAQDIDVAAGYGFICGEAGLGHRVKKFPHWQEFSAEQDAGRQGRLFALDVIDIQKVNSAVILVIRDQLLSLLPRKNKRTRKKAA